MFSLVDSAVVDFKGRWWLLLSSGGFHSLSLWVAESGSVETEGALPVDCTATIKSVLG